VIGQIAVGVVNSPRYELEWFVRLVPAVQIANDQMTLDLREYVAKIFGIRAKRSLCPAQLEGLAGFLKEVHQFVDFEKAHEGIEKAGKISVDQPH
jgi:hypothetical protein